MIVPRLVGAWALLSATLATAGEAQVRAQEEAWTLELRPVLEDGPAWNAAGGVAEIPARVTPPWVAGKGGRPAPAFAAALSAVLPGSGQIVMDQRRGWLYLGLELAAWIGYADRRGAAASFRARYREFAWERARIAAGPRKDGTFEYYETLTQWTRSGAFDRDADAAGVQPETDLDTYNGFIWARARSIFGASDMASDPDHPEHEAALQYYEQHAYDEAFLWDWSDAPEARDTFASLIDASDTRARQATTVLGVLIANHLIAAADGFLSARRLSARVGPGLIHFSWRTY